MKNVLGILFLLASFKLHAFTLSFNPNVFFPDPKVTINISNGSCGSSGISTDDIRNWIQGTIDDYWNTVSTSAIELQMGSVISTDLTTADKDNFNATGIFASVANNTILIGCNDLNNNFTNVTDAVLAGASISSRNGLVNGVVLVNINADFSDEKQNVAVIAHEIGHALGLGHSSDPVALMYFSVGDKTQERLTMDDRDAITYLYPHEKKLPASCGSIAFVGNRDDNDNDGGNSGLLSFLLGFMIISLIIGLIKRAAAQGRAFYGNFSRRQTSTSY